MKPAAYPALTPVKESFGDHRIVVEKSATSLTAARPESRGEERIDAEAR
jgi:hypothetical protein